jgi:hypothetical protein
MGAVFQGVQKLAGGLLGGLAGAMAPDLPQLPPPPPPPPAPTFEAAKPPPPPQMQAPQTLAAANEVTAKARGAAGPSSTIATSAQGLVDPANLALKSLIGD